MGKIPKNAGMVFKNHLEAQKRYEDGDELLQRSQQNSGALFLLFSGLCAAGVHRGQDPVPEPQSKLLLAIYLYQPRGVGWGRRWEGGSKGRGYMYTYG